MLSASDRHAFGDVLAEVLRSRNPRWRERTHPGRLELEPSGGAPRPDAFRAPRRPDVLIAGDVDAPVVIETDFAPAATVESDAMSRLGGRLKSSPRAVANAIALRAPSRLRGVDQAAALREVEACRDFEFALFAGLDARDEEPGRWPESGWLRGGADDLADLVEACAAPEGLVSEMLEAFEAGVRAAADHLRSAAGTSEANERIASLLHQEDGVRTTRMAMAILVNAFTYHALIAGQRGARSVDACRLDEDRIAPAALLAEWRRILTDVKGWPIFHIARDIASAVPARIAEDLLGDAAKLADRLVASGVMRSQDLVGRLFQRLIADRKFLATFYTLPTSATLLAELAVRMMDVDWRDPNAVAGLRIADFACGTGALLFAAFQAALRRHRRAGGDDRMLQADMVERSLFGADIMPAATHLTAAMLSSANPTGMFRDARVYTLPYGMDSGPGRNGRARIGSLDLLDDRYGASMFPTETRRTAGRDAGREVAGEEVNSGLAPGHGSMDLVIMNPPFTRPTNHETADVPIPSFAGFATRKDEQRRMSEALAKRKERLDFPVGDGNAGLASNFVDLAHVKLRPGGALALVLPLSMVNGRSWTKVRRLLSERYENVLLVSIAREATQDCSFSADTGMGEVLVVARKKKTGGRGASASPGARRPASPVRWASLHARPGTEREALLLAGRIGGTAEERGPAVFRMGAKAAGWTIRASLDHAGYAGLADPELAECAIGLESGTLRLPGSSNAFPLPMAKLRDVADRGRLSRDVNGVNSDGSPRGPLDIEALRPDETAAWPALWNHDAERERRLVVAPDAKGRMRPGMERRAGAVRRSLSHLHSTSFFQLNSQSLAACWTEEKTIGGAAWPNVLVHDPSHEKTLLLWQNTTLGLLLFWWRGARQQSGRANLTISRLPSLRVLDAGALPGHRRDRAAGKIFDAFRERTFLPANEAYRDDVRKELDRAMLIDLIGLPETVLGPLDLLRDRWCAEPSVHGGKKTRIPTGLRAEPGEAADHGSVKSARRSRARRIVPDESSPMNRPR